MDELASLVSHGRATPNGVRIHYVEAGPADGPLVVLLHGFPEFWYSWRRQIPALIEAGYRVVAPDLRGFNRSGKPDGIDPYRIRHVVDDIAGLVASLGADDAAVAGHDWGGVIAWELAMRRPSVVRRLAVLNAPHRGALAREATSLEQLRKSWYVFVFGLPKLPELAITARDYRWVEFLFDEDPEADDAFDSAEIRRYKTALSRPGAVTATLNYYRAAFRTEFLDVFRSYVPGLSPSGDAPSVTEIAVPTLVLWGVRDSSLSVALTEGLDEWVADVRVERFPDVGHWVQNEAPERVTRSLLDFFGAE